MRHVLSYHITYLLALYLKDLSGLCLHNSGCCKILYADNILFNSPSIRQLEKLLHACKEELYWLDVAVDFKKSCCLTIGARCDTHCANSPSVTGSMLLRMNTVRYLGVYFARAKYFKCSFSHGKRSFHRADNSIFEKIGRYSPRNPFRNLLKANVPICRFYYIWYRNMSSQKSYFNLK